MTSGDTPTLPAPGDAEAPAFSLFATEEKVLKDADVMLRKLQDVSDGVRTLADAYNRGYREQRRLVRLSDRMQLDLQTTNQQVSEQAETLRMLNDNLLKEIDRRKKLEEELRRLATEDSLTGVYTRRHILELAEHDLRRSLRDHTPFTVLLIDIDHFKRINDTHGHAAGDSVLRRFGEHCRAGVREVDVVGRLGGEEFAVFMPATDLEEAHLIAERLRSGIASQVFDLGAARASVTISIGLAQRKADETTLEAMMGRADSALYLAKNGGRNRTVADWEK